MPRRSSCCSSGVEANVAGSVHCEKHPEGSTGVSLTRHGYIGHLPPLSTCDRLESPTRLAEMHDDLNPGSRSDRHRNPR